MNRFIYIVFIFSSCYNLTQEKIDRATQLQLQDRKADFFTERSNACRRVITAEAEILADSILRIEAKKAKLDSIRAPHDTLKPNRPDIIFPDYKKPERTALDSSISRG